MAAQEEMSFRAWIGVIGVMMVLLGGSFLLFPDSENSCGGRSMKPGDLCDTYQHGQLVETKTLGQVQNDAHRTRDAAPWLVGIGVVLVVTVSALSARSGHRPSDR